MSAAERAFRPGAQRVVLRHSALTRICHGINAVCFFALLMSGLQIFNAHPTLNFGQTTDSGSAANAACGAVCRTQPTFSIRRFVRSWRTLSHSTDLI